MYPGMKKGTMESRDQGEEEVTPPVDRWGVEIPPELLLMIFEKLMIGELNQTELAEWKQALLSCRGTHPRWATVMDPLLEEKCLETWSKSEISLQAVRSDHLFNLTYLPVMPAEDVDKVITEWVFCPPPGYQGVETHNPFPTKSLRVAPYHPPKRDSSNRKSMEGYQIMGVIPFFSNYGHHLTSLVLDEIHLASETFQGILGHTTHLKSLTLDTVRIYMDLTEERLLMKHKWSTSPSSYPPPLPQLQHLRLFDAKAIRKRYGSREDGSRTFLEWLLEPYQKQLLTLGMDVHYSSGLGVASFDFAVLKKLAVWLFHDLRFLRDHMRYPQLESLSLVPLDDDYLRWQTLECLQWHLAPFAETLVEFHLQLRLRSYENMEYTSWDDSDVEKDLLPYFKEFRWSNAGILFPKLKTLSISFFTFLNEQEAVKDMLSCLPNLETLNLLKFRENWLASMEPTEEDFENVEQILNRESNDWKACTKLRKIRVMMEDCEKSIFFTKQFPDVV